MKKPEKIGRRQKVPETGDREHFDALILRTLIPITEVQKKKNKKYLVSIVLH